MNTQILDDVDNWQDAVKILMGHYTVRDKSFSSCDIANEIRKLNPKLNFTVQWVGRYIQELFYSNEILFTVQESKSKISAFMVSRVTTGISRKGPVFVYASHPSLAEEHNFEIDILKPDFDNELLLPTWVPYACKKEWDYDEITQERFGKYSVRIHSDGRMCFTRPLLERFFHNAKCPVKSNTKVYVAAETGKVTLTLESTDGSSEHTLSTSRGRVLYSVKESLKAGDLYDCIEISDSEITVTLR